ncbi:MAG: hypothetical protein QNJ47_24625 [Nostocaceae cyanobacterium]|nr:hypothetical protein [Nostocaceae cyanobacterium]
MGWRPLRERIHNLPLVLAGPVVRHTDKNTITVWVALKESRTVTLEVFDINKHKLLSGSQKTVQIGVNLHIATVTAKSNTNILLYGENYLYDLYFGLGETLISPGILTPGGSIDEIKYPQYELPSFPLVPNNFQDLRIIHGSCRKPHGESLDALVAVDKMIQEALETEPKKRPHQLFLTGDQIYADDVADALLLMLMDAGETLLGWSEVLPDVENIEELKPGKRNNLATHTAGFTASIGKIGNIANIAKSHLFTLGEFLAMYLFTWCDVLWVDPEDFPTFAELELKPGLFAKNKSEFNVEVEHLKLFYSTIKNVRRALANIPTYMIFDDHEITDDWYLNIAWCDRVLNKPLGRRVLQNGMLAYALCQGWGNTPERFAQGTSGEALLEVTQAWLGNHGTNKQQEEEIYQRLGLPTYTDIINSHSKRIPISDFAIKWHYTVTGPGYEVIVLDTRTCREFPGDKFDFPALLSPEAFDSQISDLEGNKNAEVTLVISSGPVIGIPFLETVQKYAKAISEKFGSAAWGFDTEAWSLEETTFERFFARLALRALPNQRNRVIILSGDVHYGFAARLQYSAIRPFEHPQKVNTDMIVVQFTSSSLRNEVEGMGGSHSLHIKGFVPMKLITDRPTAEVIGWTNSPGEELNVGIFDIIANETLQRIPWRLTGNPAKIDLVQERGSFRDIQITKKPDWWYRIDFIDATAEDIYVPDNVHTNMDSVVAPLPGENRKQPLEKYIAMAKNHLDYTANNHGREIVGVNNIGEITFESVNGKNIAVQTLWWRLKSWEDGKLLQPFPLTRCEVSLDFDDKEHPLGDVLREVVGDDSI